MAIRGAEPLYRWGMNMVRLPWNRVEDKPRKRFEKDAEFGFEVESLESRRLLVGTVDVVVKGDNLVITGDSEANQINVGVNAGHVEVEGLAGTTVEGGATDLAAADLNKLTITMKGGDDHVLVVATLEAQGNVKMTGAAGNDVLNFAGTAGRKLQIIGGKGEDEIGFFATANGKTTLNGGGDGDLFTLQGFVNDKLTLKGGGGDDIVNVEAALTFTFDVTASLGGGADTINLGAGVSFADARLTFGGGDDIFFAVALPAFAGKVLLNGGGGFDLSFPDPDTLALPPNVTIKSFEGAL